VERPRCGRQRREAALEREHIEGEQAEAADDRLADERPARLPDIGQCRHLLQQRLLVCRQLGR
jgi:hypothetical protein